MLSKKELKSFKRYIRFNGKGNGDRRLALFNAILGTRQAAELPDVLKEFGYSRQNAYQIAKRLRNQLYEFLLSLDADKCSAAGEGDKEMYGHRMVYFIKLLLQKGNRDEAEHLLNELLCLSDKNNLHLVRLVATDLKNEYFPLSDKISDKKCAYGISCLDTLKIRHFQSEYFQTYLQESVFGGSQTDHGLRNTLIRFLEKYSTEGYGWVVDDLIRINQFFKERKFREAHEALHNYAHDIDLKNNAKQIENLISLDMAKALTGLNELDQAKSLLHGSQSPSGCSIYWSEIVHGAKYALALRSSDTGEQWQLIDRVARLSFHEKCEQILRPKWQLFTAFHYYATGNFKNVVKLANTKVGRGITQTPYAGCMKLLELISIYKLQDFDWFYFKSECLRKQFSYKSSTEDRLLALHSALKNLYLNSNGPRNVAKELKAIEFAFPWDPLGHELINLTTCIGSDIMSEIV